MMERDEIQVSREELQKWIRRKVKKSSLMVSDVLEKCNLLRSLLERREKQAAQLLRLCQSVSVCEATVRKQYSLLGWKYKDKDSDDDDDNITGCGNTVPSPPTTDGPTPLLPKLQYSESPLRDNGEKNSLEPVVVLTRISSRKITPLRLPSPDSGDEFLNKSDSDKEWQPQDDSSDSDYSLSSNRGPNKRRKLGEQNEKPAKSHAKPQASKSTDAKSNVTKASTPPARTKRKAKSKLKQKSKPQASANTADKSNVTKTSTPPSNTKAVSTVCITTLRQTPVEATKTPPCMTRSELKVNMTVLARQKAMNWQHGKITEIITKGGRTKYKIHIEEKGKVLVSGHHVAFDSLPNVDKLYVGARVVVKLQADQCQFCAGILGELPSRKNRMRFLVFIDDHTPVYVALPLLHLVCKPLEDPLDDVPDGFHKDFLKDYLKAWPYPPQTQYRVGQEINVEFKGVLQRCEVKAIDCSLIEVVVLTDRHTEWIYRGSTCLEHIINLRGPLESKKEEGQKKKSPRVDESSKSAH